VLRVRDNTTVFITGAAGFVGRKLCASLHARKGWNIVGLSRQTPDEQLARHLSRSVIADLCDSPDLQSALQGVDVIVHLASRVHSMEVGDSLALYRDSNVRPARHMIREAIKAGVRRFVFISTVKVNGEETNDQPFTGDQRPAPAGPYARSKMEAEEELMRLAEGTALEVVILRPPLVYGPGVKANFLSLMGLAARGWPLPLGSIRNRRSLLHVDNLTEAIVFAATSSGARNRIFTISDDGAISTPELINKMSLFMGKKSYLIRFPVRILEWFAGVLGLTKQISRLTVNLEADNSQFKNETGWKPVKTTDEGLSETVDWFLSQR
jgi:nucleoside-diphosphate-sugar epimerase